MTQEQHPTKRWDRTIKTALPPIHIDPERTKLVMSTIAVRQSADGTTWTVSSVNPPTISRNKPSRETAIRQAQKLGADSRRDIVVYDTQGVIIDRINWQTER